ncbi:universal stress protein [Chitinilyticum litopenaei]|uniref:universal stress protein n=1 Tax=Chitinilyticum litopenaei TaxID=1121276 RepID=UPI0003F6BD90|nr:universal stress protein [Chitinilyticum litopenaei]
MPILLIPVDGSAQSLRAVQAALLLREQEGCDELLLLHVQLPLIGRTRGFFTDADLDALYREDAERVFAPARALLQAADLPFRELRAIGQPAEMIVRVARQEKVAHIVMGTRGRGAATALLLGSVASKVLSAADVPVTLVNQEAPCTAC